MSKYKADRRSGDIWGVLNTQEDDYIHETRDQVLYINKSKAEAIAAVLNDEPVLVLTEQEVKCLINSDSMWCTSLHDKIDALAASLAPPPFKVAGYEVEFDGKMVTVSGSLLDSRGLKEALLMHQAAPKAMFSIGTVNHSSDGIRFKDIFIPWPDLELLVAEIERREKKRNE